MIKVNNIKYFGEGKRSIVYTAYYKNKKVIIKNPKNKINTIANEVKFLKILNKNKIGPKLIYYDDYNLVCEFVYGLRITDWIRINNNKSIKKNLKKIFDECRLLDKLKIDKKELTNPYKHILIDKNPVMIDFERARFNENPKNVSQFSQFIMSKRVYEILIKKGIKFDNIKLIKAVKKYKKSYSEKDYNSILKSINITEVS
ncbi:hypothetical protein HYX17_02790 [Candidatus Woesearchaeota archaeon]|nr:hypothetical protein [Candidatus Woesearchaeota archaeon]